MGAMLEFRLSSFFLGGLHRHGSTLNTRHTDTRTLYHLIPNFLALDFNHNLFDTEKKSLISLYLQLYVHCSSSFCIWVLVT